MKHKFKVVLGALTALLIASCVIGGVFFLSSKYLDNESSTNNAEHKACESGQHTVHEVKIKDSKAEPFNTTAQLCDTLTITNTDDRVRLMAFGLHEEHDPYDGTEEKALEKGESLTVTLIKAGNFRFHDHILDDAEGTFTVTEPRQ